MILKFLSSKVSQSSLHLTVLLLVTIVTGLKNKGVILIKVYLEVWILPNLYLNSTQWLVVLTGVTEPGIQQHWSLH